MENENDPPKGLADGVLRVELKHDDGNTVTLEFNAFGSKLVRMTYGDWESAAPESYLAELIRKEYFNRNTLRMAAKLERENPLPRVPESDH